jgi:predicted nuclease of predicted toxin-antitoxin system
VILADVNVQGQVDLLMTLMRGEPWREMCEDLHIDYVHFSDVGLDRQATDADIWNFCQERECVLITNNRNDDGPESLETAIRQQNTPNSLPVFTLANAERIRHSRAYADRVIESLLDALQRIDSLRGVGRLYLP